jgi:hypothetical protein
MPRRIRREVLPQSELLRLCKQKLSVLLSRIESDLRNPKAEFRDAPSRGQISGRASSARDCENSRNKQREDLGVALLGHRHLALQGDFVPTMWQWGGDNLGENS